MMNPVIGVVGGADVVPDERMLPRASRLGRTIAERGCAVVTVSDSGLSRTAAEGARAAGGRVIDIPAGGSAPRAEMPPRAADPEDEAIRRADIVVIVGGSFGPPGDLAAAYAERRPIGVLTQTRGVADAVEALVRACARPDAGPVLCDDDPNRLVDRLIDRHRQACHGAGRLGG